MRFPFCLRNIFSLLLVLAVTAYTAWSWFFERGIYGWLIQKQHDLLGQYYPFVTGMLRWVFLLVIPAACALRVGPGEAGWREEDRLRQDRAGRNWLLLLLFLTLGLSGGAYHLSKSAPGASQAATEIDVSEFDPAEQDLFFTKVRLTGGKEARETMAYLTEEGRHGNETRFYIPYLSDDGSNKTIQFFHVVETNVPNPGSAPVLFNGEGSIRPGVVPIVLREVFTQQGFQLADQIYLVVGERIYLQELYWIVAGVSGMLGFFLLIAWVARAFRKKKDLAP